MFITKSWTFDGDTQGWVPQTGGIESLSFESSLGNPAGCLSNTQTGRNQRGVDAWQLEGTWESIFGIPSGSMINSILAPGDGFDSKCDIYDNAAPSVAGPLAVGPVSLQFPTLIPGRSYSSIDVSWVRQVPEVFNQSINQPSNTLIYFILGATVVTGSHSNPVNRLLLDNITITVMYS